jgi:pimeloyl-ACP methyl ester carboxylesterase
MSSDSGRPLTLGLPDGSRIAYRAIPGCLPGVVFLGGFTSDMTGTKATELDAHCRANRSAYVRFDYTGHGASSGRFEDGTIGQWVADAVAVLDNLTHGPQVLVGSSMGGWIMVLAALARPERVAGLVGVAAAPDFTEELLRKRFDSWAKDALKKAGVVHLPNPYGDEPTPITRRLIDEGRSHLVMKAPISVSCPVRLLHGMADPDVPWELSIRLAELLESPNVTVTLVKSGDHRMSDRSNLALLLDALDEVRGIAASSSERTA